MLGLLLIAFIAFANSTNGCLVMDLTPVPGTGCQSFYRCISTNLYQFNCGTGLLFNPATKLCTLSTVYRCADQSGMTTTPASSSGVVNTNIPCPSTLEYTQLPTDCTKFYICSATTNTLIVKSCSTGTIFSANVKNCVPPQFAVCNSAPPTIISCPSGAYKRVPGSGCMKYYICEGTTPVEVNCPSGQLYDENFFACSPALTTCPDTSVTQAATTATTTPMATQPPSSSAMCPTADLTPVAGQCKIFIRCIGTTMYQFSCPNGQLFNRSTRTCQTMTTCV